jgi:hypothetical protein
MMTRSRSSLVALLTALSINCGSHAPPRVPECPTAYIIWPFRIFLPHDDQRIAFTLIEVPLARRLEFLGQHIRSMPDGACEKLSVNYLGDNVGTSYESDPKKKRVLDWNNPCDQIEGDFLGPDDLALPLVPFFVHTVGDTRVAGCIDTRGNDWVAGGARSGSDGVGCEVVLYNRSETKIAQAFHLCSTMRIVADLPFAPYLDELK